MVQGFTVHDTIHITLPDKFKPLIKQTARNGPQDIGHGTPQKHGNDITFLHALGA